MLRTPKLTRTRFCRGFKSVLFRRDTKKSRTKVAVAEFCGGRKHYGRVTRSNEHPPGFSVSRSKSGYFVQVRERTKNSGIQARQSLALQEIETRPVDGRAVDGNGIVTEEKSQGGDQSRRSAVSRNLPARPALEKADTCLEQKRSLAWMWDLRASRR